LPSGCKISKARWRERKRGIAAGGGRGESRRRRRRRRRRRQKEAAAEEPPLDHRETEQHGNRDTETQKN
jgi:hypothetical protein